jgi:hypothetical protein
MLKGPFRDAIQKACYLNPFFYSKITPEVDDVLKDTSRTSSPDLKSILTVSQYLFSVSMMRQEVFFF